jgi:hypothetical protein
MALRRFTQSVAVMGVTLCVGIALGYAGTKAWFESPGD